LEKEKKSNPTLARYFSKYINHLYQVTFMKSYSKVEFGG